MIIFNTYFFHQKEKKYLIYIEFNMYIYVYIFNDLKLNEIIFSNNIYKNISVFQYLY